jgi:hypothetical protein
MAERLVGPLSAPTPSRPSLEFVHNRRRVRDERGAPRKESAVLELSDEDYRSDAVVGCRVSYPSPRDPVRNVA